MCEDNVFFDMAALKELMSSMPLLSLHIIPSEAILEEDADDRQSNSSQSTSSSSISSDTVSDVVDF